ncbi:MAG: hypothetical protein WDO73_06260 [Ignavibacteriota bacterium]
MSYSAEAKLHELRNKTTRQLVSLISNKLDRGLAFARVMESDNGDWASTEHFATNAEKALAEATSWMALLNGATPLEQRRLDFKLSQLREALERSHETEMRAHAAC